MPKKVKKTAWGGRDGRNPSNFNEPFQNDYFDHDYRVPQRESFTKSSKNNGGGTRPRVSFKNQVRARHSDFVSVGGPNAESLKRILDDDFPMTAGSNNNTREVIFQRGRGRGLPRGRNSPLMHRGGMHRLVHDIKMNPLNDSTWNSWYKIIIPHGHKYRKEIVIESLLKYMAPQTFTPIMYKAVGYEAVFYVDDQKTAMNIEKCDKRVTIGDSHALSIRVRRGFPHCDVDQGMKDKMKQAMAKRYVQETNALDLSRFHHDPELVDEYFCALSRPAILVAVLDIVSTVIPNLEALNLDRNKFHIINRLHLLPKTLPSLKILYIGENQIKEIQQLDAIKELKLEELRLAGNPVCEKYKTRHDDYVSDVRRRFPKLLRLDGTELPRPILFDVANDGIKLPPSQRMFVLNTKAQDIASQFLQQYFLVFDSANRQPLLDAYHEQACFSLTVAYMNNSNKFTSYLSDNRNLYRVNDVGRRRKLLKQGRLPVVSYISEMPRTRHDLNSFTMDIGLVTDGMMLITVSGLFKEPETKDEPLRYFNRTFIIVPEGSGYCIRNEQLHISQPTAVQEKQALQVTPIPTATQVTNSIPGPATASTSAPLPVSDDLRQQMTLTLSQQTNMNLEWSLKCLKEVEWNFDNALAAFHEFFKRGQIPSEAFNK